MTFTVDALPNQIFRGRVGKIRLNATMSQNVVTYTVEVNTNNDDGKLLPYLTANAKFKIGHRQGVLLVPNAALRWSPRPNQIAPGFSTKIPAADRRNEKKVPVPSRIRGHRKAASFGFLKENLYGRSVSPQA